MPSIESALRARLPERRMWLCLAAGDARSFGGHAGYDDDPSSRYQSDDRVPNTQYLKEGDVIVVWDKSGPLGVSIIDRVDRGAAAKTLFKCPRCNKTSIKRRSNLRPIYRCQSSCGFEFDEPKTEIALVATAATFHEPGWVPLDDLPITPQHLRDMCISPKSQHSIREMDPIKTTAALGPFMLKSVKFARTDYGWAGMSQGHRERTVRVRLGQSDFRKQLLREFGPECVVSGGAPEEALEAAHLYSYAQVGEHQRHGGLLLRRDLHRLFDAGLLGIEPGPWRLRLSEPAFKSESYRLLDGAEIGPRLNDRHKFWLGEHWSQHELGRRVVGAL